MANIRLSHVPASIPQNGWGDNQELKSLVEKKLGQKIGQISSWAMCFQETHPATEKTCRVEKGFLSVQYS